jgi:hypothetical protein
VARRRAAQDGNHLTFWQKKNALLTFCQMISVAALTIPFVLYRFSVHALRIPAALYRFSRHALLAFRRALKCGWKAFDNLAKAIFSFDNLSNSNPGARARSPEPRGRNSRGADFPWAFLAGSLMLRSRNLKSLLCVWQVLLLGLSINRCIPL